MIGMALLAIGMTAALGYIVEVLTRRGTGARTLAAAARHRPMARTGARTIRHAGIVVSTGDPFANGWLATQPWTVAVEIRGPRVEQRSPQPFTWNLAHGWTTSSSSRITTSWHGANGWTVPLVLGLSNLAVVGRQPVSVALTYFNNVIRPPGTGSSQIRLVTSFLYPKAHAK